MTSYASPSIRLARPDIGDEEIEAVARVLRSGQLTLGPETAFFEQEFAAAHDAAHGVAFANGTVALSAIHLGLGIGPGDEVITPSLTFISSATSVLHVGATPVFADVDPRYYNLDPADVARRITSDTSAILAVHYGGQSADMEALTAIGDEAGIPVIEDAAEAHGARFRGKSVGALGRASMFSFTPTKNITTGEGGMVCTNDGDLADRLRLLRNHGQTGQYRHEILGYNWRMSEMQAAIGRVQLTRLPAILERKRRISGRLGAGLEPVPEITPPAVAEGRDHVFMLYSTLVENGRDRLMNHLISEGIEARLYFPPAHRQPIFSHPTPDLPVTEWLSERLLSLPAHSLLTDAEVDHIVTTVARLIASPSPEASQS